MIKISADIQDVLRRTIPLVPNSEIPLTISAGATCLGALAGLIDRLANPSGSKTKPNRETILLACLLCARAGISGDKGKESIADAYADLEALKKAGRL